MKARVLLAIALLAVGLTFAVSEQPAAAALPNPPTSVSVTITGSTAHLTWSTPAATLPERLYYQIIANDTTSSPSTFFGEAWACAGCTSYDWPALLADHTYSFTIRAINKQYESSTAVTVSDTVPDVGCSGSDLCVAVDGSDAGWENRFVASGLLHGVESSTEPDFAEFVEPLNVQQWRLDPGVPAVSGQGATWAYLQNNSFSPSTTAILSDRWVSYANANDLKRPCGILNTQVRLNPWANRNFFKTWLGNEVAAEITAGREPTYWDIFNEVNDNNGQPFYSTKGNAALELLNCIDRPSSTSLWAMLKDATDVLHGLDQKAIAPSYVLWSDMSAFNRTDIDAPDGVGQDPLLNFNTLLINSDTNNVAWDGFSYHQITSSNGTGVPARNFEGTPRAVITNASQARALIANHPLQAGADLFINEYLGAASSPATPEPGGHIAAGRLAGLMWGMTIADPVEANLSCAPFPTGGNPNGPGTVNGNDCHNGSLDGLLDIDGSGDPHKRPGWWVYWAYGQLAGNVVEAASNNATLTALSAYDDTGDGAVRTLLGRYDYSTSRPDEDTTVHVTLPDGWDDDVTVTIQAIPNGASAYDALDTLPSAAVCDTTADGNGVATVTIDDFADNDAYLVTVTPLDGSNPAC